MVSKCSRNNDYGIDGIKMDSYFLLQFRSWLKGKRSNHASLSATITTRGRPEIPTLNPSKRSSHQTKQIFSSTQASPAHDLANSRVSIFRLIAVYWRPCKFEKWIFILTTSLSLDLHSCRSVPAYTFSEPNVLILGNANSKANFETHKLVSGLLWSNLYLALLIAHPTYDAAFRHLANPPVL